MLLFIGAEYSSFMACNKFKSYVASLSDLGSRVAVNLRLENSSCNSSDHRMNVDWSRLSGNVYSNIKLDRLLIKNYKTSD